MESFSKYFTFEELTNSTSHSSLVAQNRLDASKYMLAGKRLSKLLESIRHILGDSPLKVNSGFRNARLNNAVGSKALNSKHTVFEAADIVPKGMSIKEAFTALIMAHKGGLLPDLRKVLQEGTWLHIETKMDAKENTTFWTSNDGNKTWNRVA